MERTFDKVSVLFPAGGGHRGALVIADGSLEFRSKKGTVQLEHVKSIYTNGDLLTIEFGEGTTPRSLNFQDQSQGITRGKFRAANEQLVADIRQALGLAPPSDEEQQKVKEILGEAARSKMRNLEREGRRYMIIGAIMLVVGTIVTLATYQAASESGGGRYIVAWGAMGFGALGLIGGFIQWQIAKRR